ncbi:MAG: IS110 family transposase [Actinomycetota bacterium]
MDIHGIGPAGAARILADVGDVARFPDRNHFASWTGTAPTGASSGEHARHRLSRAGEPQAQPRALYGRHCPAPQRHCGPGLLPAQAAGAQDINGSHAVPAPAPVRCCLPSARRGRCRPCDRAGGPGRAIGGGSVIQRGRPDPGHRLFGPATSRTRTLDATRTGARQKPCWAGDRRHTATTRRRCQRGAPHWRTIDSLPDTHPVTKLLIEGSRKRTMRCPEIRVIGSVVLADYGGREPGGLMSSGS